MHLSTQAIFYSIRIVSSILRFRSHEIHRLDAKLLLEALGKIARTAETYHIADFADAVVSFFQELCALLQFHELDHLVWRNIAIGSYPQIIFISKERMNIILAHSRLARIRNKTVGLGIKAVESRIIRSYPDAMLTVFEESS